MSYDGNVIMIGNIDLYTQAGWRTAAIAPTPADEYTLFQVNGLNDDGSAFVGDGPHATGISWGFGLYQRDGGTFRAWGSLSQGYQATARGVSGDGNRVLIESGSLSYPAAGLATTDGSLIPATPRGILDSASYTSAIDISRNGNAYIGHAGLESTSVDYRFRVGGGVDPLWAPTQYEGQVAWATDLSDDGDVVVGRVFTGRSTSAMCFWNGLDATAVLSPDGYESGFATAVSGGGDLIAASHYNGSGPNTVTHAYLWSPSMGWRAAGEFFAMHGVAAPNATSIVSITEISSDGLTFLGKYDNGQSFLVVIPAPSSLALLGVAAFASRRRRG
jgi:uncharacterized membrane protein